MADAFMEWYERSGQYTYVPGFARPVLRGSGQEDRLRETWYSHRNDPPESNGEVEEEARAGTSPSRPEDRAPEEEV